MSDLAFLAGMWDGDLKVRGGKAFHNGFSILIHTNPDGIRLVKRENGSCEVYEEKGVGKGEYRCPQCGENITLGKIEGTEQEIPYCNRCENKITFNGKKVTNTGKIFVYPLLDNSFHQTSPTLTE